MQNSKNDAEIIGLIGLAHSISHFFHLIIVPLFPWIKAEFGLSYAELGLLMTVFYVTSSVVQATSGLLVDRYGARPILFLGVALLALSATTLGLSHHYWMLIVGMGLAGVGNGVFHPVNYTMINHLVKTPNLPHAYSVHGVTGYLGWAGAPLFLLALAALFDSWRAAEFGAAILACGVLVLLFWRKNTFNDHAEKPHEEDLVPTISTLSIFKLPSMWMSWLFFYLTSFSFVAIQSFSSTALVDIYQIPLTLTASSYTLFMIASAVGLIVGGFVSAKFPDPDKVITSAFILSGVMALIIGLGIFPGWTMPIVFAIMGFGGGMAAPARDLMVRAATPKGASGRIFGLVYSGIDFGSSSGPLLFGLFMDWKSPQSIFYAMAILQLGAIVVASQLNRMNQKNSAYPALA